VTETINSTRTEPEGGDLRGAGEGQPLFDVGTTCNLPTFLRTLFHSLDESDVRYCVLHSWEHLQEGLPTDLDLAVHGHDQNKLVLVFQNLKDQGYTPFQCFNYSRNASYFVFFWWEGSSLRTCAVDIIVEHWRSGLLLSTGEELVAGRLRHRDFWIPAPSIEFGYLLAKKAWKRGASITQSRRLGYLVEQLGYTEAERIASGIFPSKSKKRIVEACNAGLNDGSLSNGRTLLRWIALTRHPLRLVRYLTSECRRVIRRHSQPTGIIVAVLGPDGSGKSTVISGLKETFSHSFRRQRLFHWRPQMFARQGRIETVSTPHAKAPRGTLVSLIYLSVFFVDHWIGHFSLIHPLRARSGFILFDRYFHDILVDSRRYRYGGPRWFAEFLARLAPEPDLVILLDDKAENILARKNELSRAELLRQLQAYRKLRFRRAEKVLVRTERDISATLKDSSKAVAEFLGRRFDRRFPGEQPGIQ
jgi:thymidylate kinase